LSIYPTLVPWWVPLQEEHRQMGIYRTLWRRVVCAFAVVGAANAVLALPGRNLIGLAVCAAIVGPTVGAWLHARTSGAAFPPPSSLLMASALATVGAVAVVGLIALFGARVPLVAVLGLLAVCSPAVLGRLPGRASQAARHDPHTVVSARSAQPSPPSCHSLSDAELCWRWRTSAAALRHTVSADQRLYLIETRSALLDEFARRHPAGFTRWVHSGTHSVNDPARFLTTPGGTDRPAA